MRRRSFLKLLGCYSVSAAVPGALLAGCGGGRGEGARFPQGVASGDPRPGSVVLWTRAEPRRAGTRPWLRLRVASDAALNELVVDRGFEVGEESDYTLRVLVRDLQPDSVYFYRFEAANGEVSMLGRTRTAPAADAEVAVNLAFVSCQDLRHGYYNAYRRMLADDQGAPADRRLNFVLHLGDFIYETLDDPLQHPIRPDLQPLPAELAEADGRPRGPTGFPDGATNVAGIRHARSLADYRHLYRSYLADPDLQAARARWPFIIIFDDHEFSDDCWQSEANYSDSGQDSSVDEPSQPRKLAANRAWFEYSPVNLSLPDGVDAGLWQADEFVPAAVGTTPNRVVDDTNLAVNPDNLAAIGSLTTYRSFRFGRWLELLLTDNRSYRSDHAVPEDISGNLSAFFHPRIGLPLELVRRLDAGREDNDGDPATLLSIAGQLLLNPRQNSPPGSLLGARQKDWWKQTLLASPARWKLWGNSVPLMQLRVDLENLDPGLAEIILSSDTWDGYRRERGELTRFLRDNGIRNLVSLAGDLHAHYAGRVLADHDSPLQSDQQPVLAEFVAAGVSSVSQFAAVEQLTRGLVDDPLGRRIRSLIAYPAADGSGPVNNLDNTLRLGVAAAEAVAAGGNGEAVDALVASPNPHLAYADTHAQGYGQVRVEHDRVLVRLITMASITRPGDTAVARSAEFELVHAGPEDSVQLRRIG